MKRLDLYPKNHDKDIDPDLFRHPTAEYRGTPFWSWNNRLDIDQLKRQIDILRQMGFGGFHMHSRTGMATDYLGDDFMAAVKACVEKADHDHMLAWLYDEDRWPSGFAGGLVTKDHALRAKHLLLTPNRYCGQTDEVNRKSEAWGRRNEKGTFLAAYEVTLERGRLSCCRRVDEQDPAANWFAYLETAESASWFNNEAYVDTLNPKAIQAFVDVTHERYKGAVGGAFGGVVPAIFTDEPQFTHKDNLRRADERRDVFLPFTDDFFETYASAYGERLEDRLPEVLWELPDGQPSLTRYRYHDHVAERFAAAFADTIGSWCEEHGIALTGHMMEEPTLHSQTAAIGDCMRSYRSFQLPGIDMLCDWHEYTTAKQAQSATHQYGRPGVLSELYGVTSWNWDFNGHLGQGNWQAALGVTVRVPHLSWVSMAGEAKRDYPASISYQSPWWKEYPLVEDHFARVNVALTRGRPGVNVAVVHPVESYWLCYGPLEHTGAERAEREDAFKNVTDWLLFGLMDFDFVCESLLPSQSKPDQGRRLEVGEMAYQAVVVPAMRTIRATTLDRLESFAEAGGTVVFAGEVPTLVDAVPSDRAQRLASRCKGVALTRTALIGALEPFRTVDVRLSDGRPADTLLMQWREDGLKQRVFFCNTDRERARPGVRVRLKGEFAVERMDTFTGETASLPAALRDGWTEFEWTFEATGSLLLTLTPGVPVASAPVPARTWREEQRLVGPVPVTLSEPNVLLLDQAKYRLGDEPWSETTEVLRLGAEVRERLGLPRAMGDMAQPWTDKKPKDVVGVVQVRFTVGSEVTVAHPELAIEGPGTLQVLFDGAPVEIEDRGYFVDEAIRRVGLPGFGPGIHEIDLHIPFHRKTDLEWCYLLGDFGVHAQGRTARLTAPVRQLHFGDWCSQGLPFYAGNVTYHCTVLGGGVGAVSVPWFGGPLMAASLDGHDRGRIAFPPYRLELGDLAADEHRLDLTVFGNRANAFGPVHNCDPNLRWHGPGAWRTTGRAWSDEYQLKPMGVLVGPIVERAS